MRQGYAAHFSPCKILANRTEHKYWSFYRLQNVWTADEQYPGSPAIWCCSLSFTLNGAQLVRDGRWDNLTLHNLTPYSHAALVLSVCPKKWPDGRFEWSIIWCLTNSLCSPLVFDHYDRHICIWLIRPSVS